MRRTRGYVGMSKISNTAKIRNFNRKFIANYLIRLKIFVYKRYE